MTTSTAIVADSKPAEQLVVQVSDLTPSQALDRLPHAQRRLERRARAMQAAKARYLLAYYAAARLDRLAGEARIAWPVR